MNPPVKTFYFTTTETTKKIVTGIAGKLAESSGGKTFTNIDFALPEEHLSANTLFPKFSGRTDLMSRIY